MTEPQARRHPVLTSRTALIASLGLAVLAFGWLLYSSLLGPAPTDRFGDFRIVYAGGKAWLEGTSPYDIRVFIDSFLRHIATLPDEIRPAASFKLDTFEDLWGAYFYPFPPSSAILAVPLAAVDWTTAVHLNAVLGYAATIALVVVTGRLFALSPPETALLAAATFLSGSVSAAVYGGQPSIYTALGAVLAIRAVQTNTAWIFGVGCALALFKPTLTPLILAYAWFATDRKRDFAIAAILIAGGISVLPLILTWDISFVPNFIETASHHSSVAYNRYVNHQGLIAGLSSLMPQSAAAVICGVLGLIGVYGIARARVSLPVGTVVAVLLTMVLMPVKYGYDLALAVPILAFALAHGFDTLAGLRADGFSRSNLARLVSLGLLGAVCVIALRSNNFFAVTGPLLGITAKVLAAVLVTLAIAAVLHLASQRMATKSG